MTSPLVRAVSGLRLLSQPMEVAIEEFGRPDVIHDNGLWLRHNHLSALLADKANIPRVVSPRGMLEPWAMNHKRQKKRLAWAAYQKRDLMRASLIHATTEREAENIDHLALGVPVSVAPNGVDLPDMKLLERPARDIKTALFLGRIYPVKGLPMLIDAWALVKPAGWRLVIAGPDEAGHLAEVQDSVKAHSLSDVVSFCGPVEGASKRRALIDADLFVLPTHSESFGMAIAEALAFALPVLTTTGAPWPFLSEENCGWTVAPNVRDLAYGLQAATSLDLTTLRAMGANGRQVVGKRFNWTETATKMVALYAAAVSR